MKIKQVTYGVAVLINIGNYENTKHNVEITADIEDTDNIQDCINELKQTCLNSCKEEYKQVKEQLKLQELKKKNPDLYVRIMMQREMERQEKEQQELIKKQQLAFNREMERLEKERQDAYITRNLEPIDEDNYEIDEQELQNLIEEDRLEHEHHRMHVAQELFEMSNGEIKSDID